MLGFLGYSNFKMLHNRPGGHKALAPLDAKTDPEDGRPLPVSAKASDAEEYPLVARRGDHNGWTHVNGSGR